MNGKRVGTMRKTNRRYEPRRQRTATTENRASGRLLVCGVALVLLVALKLLFPQQVSAFLQDASRFIGRDANFSEAFAAVGRAVSGEETVGRSLQDAFLAVFGSSEVEVEREAEDDVPAVSQQTEPQSLSATTTLLPTQEQGSAEDSQDTPDTQSTPDNQDAPQNTQDAAEGTEPSSTYTMQSLPDNASLEQRNLGFPCTTPVQGVLTSPFGWREHPTLGGTRFHYGIDLAAEKGCEIVAFADGTVFAVGESSTLGKYIILSHSGGYRTLYAHCSEIVAKSGSVCMGDLIARVGDSGSATGAHLHFELQDGALYLNPIYYVAIQ